MTNMLRWAAGLPLAFINRAKASTPPKGDSCFTISFLLQNMLGSPVHSEYGKFSKTNFSEIQTGLGKKDTDSMGERMNSFTSSSVLLLHSSHGWKLQGHFPCEETAPETYAYL